MMKIRVVKQKDIYEVYTKEEDEWNKVFSAIGDFDFILSDNNEIKIESENEMLICSGVDECEYPHIECPHAIPHNEIENDHCRNGYDVVDDDDFCCPSCKPIKPNTNELITKEEMTLS